MTPKDPRATAARHLRQGPRTARAPSATTDAKFPTGRRELVKSTTLDARGASAPTTAIDTKTAQRKSVTFNETVQMAAAAPGAFTLPANVPRPRPRTLVPSTDWRNGSASDSSPEGYAFESRIGH